MPTEPLPPTLRPDAAKAPQRPFRRAVLRGLGLLLPPILTVVIFVWIWQTLSIYVLTPVEVTARDAIALTLSRQQTVREMPGVGENEVTALYEGQTYRRLAGDEWVPLGVYEWVAASQGEAAVPARPLDVYRRYVTIRYLQPYVVIPVFLCVFILLMYLLGKFLAAGIGRVIWNWMEKLIHRLPLIRNVYSSVKQVTDFVFSESEIQYTRVVAVEYPRKGIWSIGFATGDSLRDLSTASGEPMQALLIPTSPMPVTGYTVNVKKSECLDLNITIDQAFQFIVSCGVVVPPQQLQEALERREQGSQEQLTGVGTRGPGDRGTGG